MNRKLYRYLFLGLSLAILSGCAESEDFSSPGKYHDPDVINMSVLLDNQHENSSSLTRAAETNLVSLETVGNSFMVWGYFSPAAATATPGNLYVGESNTVGTVINYTSTGWDYANPSEKALWPSTDNPLNFQAVTPADYGTISNTPTDNVPCVAMLVTVPADQADQKDLLFGHEESVTQSSHDSSVQLTFEHAMAQVGFQARKTLASLSVEIGEITVHNVRNSATVGYTGALNGYKRTLAVSNYATSVNDYAIGLSAASIPITSSSPVQLNADDGMLMMLPQSGTSSPDAWNTTANAPVSIDNANIEGNELSYIEVSCKVHSSGSYIIGTPTTFGSIYIPFKANWAVGSKYIYTLSFGSGAGGFDQNGNPTLAIISYDVDSMEEWQTVERSALPIDDSYNITSSDEIL